MAEKQTNYLNYLNPLKVGPAIVEAIKKAHEAKDTNLLNKISIFFSSFFDKMKGIDKEKEKVKKKTKDDAEKTTKESIEEAKKASGLKEDVEDGDKEFYDEVLVMAVTSERNLEDNRKDDFDTAFEKLDNAVKHDGEEALTLDESTALGAVGLTLIYKLKAKYSDKDDFKKALDRLDKISNSSNYPLKKLLSLPVLSIFKVKMDEGSNMTDALSLLGKFGMGIGDAMTLLKIKNSPLEDKVVDVLKEKVLPNTDREKVEIVANKINEIITKKPGRIDSDSLAEIAFNVDNKDLKKLIVILGGKEDSNLA